MLNLFRKQRGRLGGILLASLLFITSSNSAQAAKVGDICDLAGKEEVELMGIGLVVGLMGTGDGGDSATTMRSLATALTLMNNPINVPDLKDADNVAVVMITAKVPATGLNRGQHIDCHVNSILGAKSLRGGRLFPAPLENTLISDDQALGLASGGIVIEDEKNLVSGKIPNGVRLLQDVRSAATYRPGQKTVTLIIDKNKADYRTADEIAKAIHDEFSFERATGFSEPSGDEDKAVSFGEYVDWIKITETTITVEIPELYIDSPEHFIALLQNVPIENPSPAAKVVVNHATKTIVITGEVDISPVAITHDNLSITVTGENGSGGFIKIDSSNPDEQSPQLNELKRALDLLQVPAEAKIEIIRELNASGKLNAILVEH
ncbi:MAG: flagellar basal body P-ring protein FlgI [Planctomycetaceae bacterium]|nr:flagellar basal body P-ring protein FlgI [Planctomycetaceae bacterium]